MERLTQWLYDVAGLSPEFQHDAIATLAVVFVLWALRWVSLRVARRSADGLHVYRWRKVSGYLAFTFGFLVIGRIWFTGFQSLTTFLGLLSAGLAIAMRDPLVNLAGWLFILWRRPFEVGDRIQIGDHAGDVIDARIFQFTLLEIGNWVDADQSTGRIIHIPNGKVFTEAQANYDKGFRYIWNEIPVLVTFESNWRKAKGLLRAIVDRNAEHLSKEAQAKIREASKKFLIFYSHLTPTVYTSVRDSGVLLTVRYLCEPRQRRGTEQAIWEEILEAFAGAGDIDFAYPTQRFFRHDREGKPALAGGTGEEPAPGSPPGE